MTWIFSKDFDRGYAWAKQSSLTGVPEVVLRRSSSACEEDMQDQREFKLGALAYLNKEQKPMRIVKSKVQPDWSKL